MPPVGYSTSHGLMRRSSSSFTTPEKPETASPRRKTENLLLRSHTDIRHLATTLQECHPSTQQLNVICPGCEPDWNCDPMEELFEAIAQLPCLSVFKLNCLGILDVPFPLKLVTPLLNNAPNLQVLDLDDVALVCTPEDVQELATAIASRRGMTPLAEFRLFGYLAEGVLQAHGQTILDPLWLALSNCRRLELDAVDMGLLGTMEASTWSTLIGENSKFRRIHVHGFPFSDRVLIEGAAALQENTTLTELSLELTTLNQGAWALVDALKCNETLQSLHVSLTRNWNDGHFLQRLASALTHNSTLRSLIVGGAAPLSDATAQQFVDMLHTNYTLELLQLGRYKGKFQAKLRYYLKLNSQQRGYYHANFGKLPRHQWTEALATSKDLDAAYYFLHMNPMLCCPRQQNATVTSDDLEADKASSWC